MDGRKARASQGKGPVKGLFGPVRIEGGLGDQPVHGLLHGSIQRRFPVRLGVVLH